MHYTREAKIGIFIIAAAALFIYVGFQLGTFRWNTSDYTSYTLYCKDAMGLIKKADVRIAGIKVGWVNDIALADREDLCAAAITLMLDMRCTLYEDACGMIRKDGLLGPTYLELLPGNAAKPVIDPGGQVPQSHADPTMDELICVVKQLTDDVQAMATSLKNTFADESTITHIKESLTLFAERVSQTTDIVQSASGFFQEGIERFKDLFFVYDGHMENMFKRAEHSCFKDSKGIFNVRVYPRFDYFYLVGVTTSQKGYIKRIAACNEYTETIKRNAYKVDLQIGKWYKQCSLRVGLIEGTGGVGADLFIPYKGHYGIISTFEMYDFHGQNRINDKRPHLKWINRCFLFDHVYLAFGVDDFISRCNSSFFLGAGFRFGEEDLKWFLPNYVGT